MSEAARIAANPNPYDILNARDALVEAAQINKDIMELGTESPTTLQVEMAAIAQSLSTYVLALNAWSWNR